MLDISKEVKQKIQQCFNEDFNRFSKTVDKGKQQLESYLEIEGKVSARNMIYLEKKLGFPCLLVDWALNL